MTENEIVDLCENILAKDDCAGAMTGLDTEECIATNRCPYCVGIKLKALGRKKDAIITKLKEALDGLRYHGCVTGDCPHYKSDECYQELLDIDVYINETLQEIKQIEREE